MAGNKEVQLNDSSDGRNLDKCRIDVGDLIEIKSLLHKKFDSLNETNDFAAAGLEIDVKEVEELVYKVGYDCCGLPQELTNKKANDVLNEKDLQNSIKNIQELIPLLLNCQGSAGDAFFVDFVETFVPTVATMIFYATTEISRVAPNIFPKNSAG